MKYFDLILSFYIHELTNTDETATSVVYQDTQNHLTQKSVITP